MTGESPSALGIYLHGATGRMGRAVAAQAASFGGGVRVRGMIELRPERRDKGRGAAGMAIVEAGALAPEDVVIDFSSPEGLSRLLSELRGTRLVSGTTGLSAGQRRELQRYSEGAAVFYEENMSYGIAIIKELLKVAAPALCDSMDVEVIEWHHRAKRDHPSGTALALARILATGGRSIVSGREKEDGGRNDAVHIHSVRVGGVPGEHQVVFASGEEVVTLSHRALSREAFARGAIEAACFIKGKQRGLYGMEDLLRGRAA